MRTLGQYILEHHSMKTTGKYIFFGIFAGGLFLIFPKRMDEPKAEDLTPYVEVIELPQGYGYQIGQNGKILIRQKYIPAVQGERPFETADEAIRIAEMVLDKLRNGHSPVITVSELEEQHITIPIP